DRFDCGFLLFRVALLNLKPNVSSCSNANTGRSRFSGAIFADWIHTVRQDENAPGPPLGDGRAAFTRSTQTGCGNAYSSVRQMPSRIVSRNCEFGSDIFLLSTVPRCRRTEST